MKQRLILIVALCFVAAASVAHAAEPDSTASAERPNSLYKGAKAIQFSTDWFNSGSINFKKHRAAGHALRLGLTFGVSSGDTEASVDTTSAPILRGAGEQSNYSLGIELIMQRYSNVFASAHVYYGLGPFFSIFTLHDEIRVTDVASGESIVEERDFDSWSAGGRLVLGAEWFVSRALSLDVEYYISGGYRSSTGESWNRFESEPDFHAIEETDEVFVSGGSARIGLGFYF